MQHCSQLGSGAQQHKQGLQLRAEMIQVICMLRKGVNGRGSALMQSHVIHQLYGTCMVHKTVLTEVRQQNLLHMSVTSSLQPYFFFM